MKRSVLWLIIFAGILMIILTQQSTTPLEENLLPPSQDIIADNDTDTEEDSCVTVITPQS